MGIKKSPQPDERCPSGCGLFFYGPRGNTPAMDPKQRTFVRLEEALSHIQDADLLLFRRRGLIAIAGRGEHSHAAKAAWWDDDLLCLEIREFKGGRAVMLESQVNRYSGRIDVLEANNADRWPEFDRPCGI